MELSFGWIFPVLCLAVMALCFLTLADESGGEGGSTAAALEADRENEKVARLRS